MAPWFSSHDRDGSWVAEVSLKEMQLDSVLNCAKSKVARQGDDTWTKQWEDASLGKNIWTGWWFGCHFLFSHILGIIIPIDFHIFQRGSNHQPVEKWGMYPFNFWHDGKPSRLWWKIRILERRVVEIARFLSWSPNIPGAGIKSCYPMVQPGDLLALFRNWSCRSSWWSLMQWNAKRALDFSSFRFQGYPLVISDSMGSMGHFLWNFLGIQ